MLRLDKFPIIKELKILYVNKLCILKTWIYVSNMLTALFEMHDKYPDTYPVELYFI